MEKVIMSVALSIRADEQTVNTTIYPRDILMKALDEYLVISQKGYIDVEGESYESFKINKIREDDNNILIDIEVLDDTEAGRILKEEIKKGIGSNISYQIDLDGLGNIDLYTNKVCDLEIDKLSINPKKSENFLVDHIVNPKSKRS